MGLFNRNKKKEIKWFVNKTPGKIQLHNKYIQININLPKTENIVFYKDIQDIKKGKKFIKITSKTEEYTFSIVSGGEDIIQDTYIQILEKVSEYKI